MDLRLVDNGWHRELDHALDDAPRSLRIISPFIKYKAAERLLSKGTPAELQVITRFNLCDFASGVSDISALRLLLDNGAAVRGVRNLHAKLFVFGDARVIVSSANLTEAAMLRNHEFGLVAGESTIVQKCRHYFDSLWQKAGDNLTPRQLAEWQDTVLSHLLKGGRPPKPTGLPDCGADIGVNQDDFAVSPWAQGAQQGFVKFFGKADNRALNSMSVLEEVERSGSHFACAYPAKARPRRVKDGALMFMGRMTKDPDDILVYGRAIGLAHVDERDVASEEEIRRRPWKKSWPNYVRVHNAEFVSGVLKNGVSMYQMMNELGTNSFRSTLERLGRGAQNINPKSAYGRQPAVELTLQSMAWLNERLESAFVIYGKLPPDELASLDWPK